jgi:hypothetical protein
VLLIFSIVAVVGVGLADFVLAVAQLHFITSLADASLPVTALPMLVGAAPATWCCAALFKLPAGLSDARWGTHTAGGLLLGLLALTAATVEIGRAHV